MIWRIDKAVFRDLLLLTLVGVVGLTFLFSALGLYQIVTRLGFTPHIATLISFAPSLTVSLLPMTLPISALLAASMVFGRMRGERELLLLSSSGVSPWRPFVSLLPFGVIVAVISAVAVSELGPGAYAQRHELGRQALADLLDHPPQGPRELRLPREKPAASIDISYQSVHDGVYSDLTILAHVDADRESGSLGGLILSLQARSARIEYRRHSSTIRLTRCFEPRMIQFDPDTGRPVGTPLIAERINDLEVPFPLGEGDAPSGHKPKGTALLVRDMLSELEEGGSKRGAVSEFVRRAGLSLAGLVLPLLGALLAAMVNHPNRLLAIGAGVIPAAVGYYPLMTSATTLASDGTLPVIAAILFAPAVALLACTAVLWRLTMGRWW